jgi:methoxymalonate biosynthesis protein
MTPVKCVVWDLDNTLLDGVYLESAGRPPGDRRMLALLGELAGRGIVHAVATRNPPEAAAYAAGLAGLEFAAAECGWDSKSAALRRIIASLGLSADAVAFIDDDLYERAEVARELPEVLVLSPEDMTDAAGWPEFRPDVVTSEAARRGEMYAQRRRRLEEARRFAGSREEFLRYCQTRMIIEPAAGPDAARLHELSVRTHQFNSAGESRSESEFAALISDAGRSVITVRLADRFCDDGMVGGCVLEQDRAAWRVELLMMSCRALGRGVIEALLAWLVRAAGRGGAAEVVVPCIVTDRNVPLRLALIAAGFRGGAGDTWAAGAPVAGAPAGRAEFARVLTGDPPALPDWVTAPGEP